METKENDDFEKEQVKKMTNLREEVLLKKGIAYFLIPSIILGIMALFLPGIYSIVPVHESDICLCYFFSKVFDETNPSDYLFLDKQSSYVNFRFVNSIAFFLINWIFLMVLIWMIYKIRHINDETLIKKGV